MRTNLIFVDTHAFDRLMLDFEGAALKQLRRLAREGHLQLILSAIVCKEVESHIEKNTAEAMGALRKFQNKARPFKSLGKTYVHFFSSYDETAATNLALSVWKDFLADTNALILDLAQAELTKIVDAYFSGKPPFGEKKKKSEFPDAIALSSLLTYLKDNKKHAYVVGGDPDILNWCDEHSEFATHVESIRVLLDIFNKKKQPELTDAVLSHLTQHKAELIDLIKASFSDLDFYYDSNCEAEVEVLMIEDIELGEPEIIEVNVYHSIISLWVTIKFNAHINGPDYSNAIWDSEEKEYFFVDYFSDDVELEESYEISFKLELLDEQNILGNVSQIEFDGSSESITLYEEDI